jgi:hypothetical protein
MERRTDMTEKTNETGDDAKVHAEPVAEETNDELSPKERGEVSGGAFNSFLYIDGIRGEG